MVRLEDKRRGRSKPMDSKILGPKPRLPLLRLEESKSQSSPVEVTEPFIVPVAICLPQSCSSQRARTAREAATDKWRRISDYLERSGRGGWEE
jgi:hypothetical protein